MTNEEAIARIKIHKSVHKMNEPRAIHISEALDMAIKALEQEGILDKIREEIEASKWTNKDVRIERNALASGLDKALEIIDKYRESEENG